LTDFSIPKWHPQLSGWGFLFFMFLWIGDWEWLLAVFRAMDFDIEYTKFATNTKGEMRARQRKRLTSWLRLFIPIYSRKQKGTDRIAIGGTAIFKYNRKFQETTEEDNANPIDYTKLGSHCIYKTY